MQVVPWGVAHDNTVHLVKKTAFLVGSGVRYWYGHLVVQVNEDCYTPYLVVVHSKRIL